MEQEKDKQPSKMESSFNKAGFFYSFIQRKTKDLHLKSQANKKNIHNKQSITIQNNQDHQQPKNNEQLINNQKCEQSITNKCNKDFQLIKKGKILRVIGQNLIPDQFRIQLVYENQTYQLTATKFQIQQNNVRVLLDWYEEELILNDDIKIV